MLYLVGDSERDLGSGFGSSAKCMPDDVLCRRVASNEGDVAGIREFARHLRRKGLVPNLSEETFVSRLGRKAEREGENVDGVGRSRSAMVTRSPFRMVMSKGARPMRTLSQPLIGLTSPNTSLSVQPACALRAFATPPLHDEAPSKADRWR